MNNMIVISVLILSININAQEPTLRETETWLSHTISKFGINDEIREVHNSFEFRKDTLIVRITQRNKSGNMERFKSTYIVPINKIKSLAFNEPYDWSGVWMTGDFQIIAEAFSDEDPFFVIYENTHAETKSRYTSNVMMDMPDNFFTENYPERFIKAFNNLLSFYNCRLTNDLF